ncbi:MAG: choice-of-anchor J domain-containing protein [bacterium]|nr:choice-of-anchor J domain-containing protein [bacterium]
MFGHKFLILSAISLFIFSFSFVASASTVIFSNGFESDFSDWTGNDLKWDTSGTSSATGVHSGSKRAQVTGATEPGDDVLLKNISISTNQGITLEFWYRIYKGLEDEDHVYVEWSGDGSNWNILNDFTALGDSATWEFASYSIPAEAGDSANFAIRFRAHLGAPSSDIFYLDDVVVSVESITNEPTPDSTGSPQATPTPEATPTSTSVPTSTPTPSTTSVPPAPTPIASPKPIAEAGNPTSTASPRPSLSPQVASTPSKTPTPTPVITYSPKSDKPITTPRVIVDEDLTTVSRSPEPDPNLSASISSFFNNSKFFWLIGIMVLAVVFSLAKPKKD